MRKILFILFLFPVICLSQRPTIGKILYDSTKISTIDGSGNELIIENDTRDSSGGVLTNVNNGRTQFKKARIFKVNDSNYVFKLGTTVLGDTIKLLSGIVGGGGISQQTLNDTVARLDSTINAIPAPILTLTRDTLSISGGNSVVLPVYVQVDSAIITSYDVLNSQNAPPGLPATGDIYLVGNSPSGAWVGHAKDIAEWNGSAWVFTDGVQGDFLYNTANALTYIFRSGNWVQTTGIPALNNGNTISSGLRIGTNNARSLTFETNNVNRGRFDSVGRFHIYNLPTSSTSDTFVTKSDLSGKLTKVGQSTFLSGVNTDAQTLSLTRDTLSISNGNSLKLPSTIFPNGVKIIEDTAYLLSSADAGYYLVAINPNTHFIMPNICPFSVGDIVGLYSDLDTATFDINSITQNVQLYTAEFAENGETLIMQCVDVGGGAEMLPLSAIIDDNGTLKTLNKYLFDKSQDVIYSEKLSDSLFQIRTEIEDTALSLHNLIDAKGTVTSIATDNTLSGGTITTSGTLKVDTTKISTKANVTIQLSSYSTNTKLTDSLSTKTNKLISFSSYTTSDTLRLTDADKVIEMNVGSANNLVIPTNTAYAFPVGTQIVLIQIGAGQTTLVPASGVTVRSSSSKLKLTGQYSGATLIKKNTNEWYLFGDITN